MTAAPPQGAATAAEPTPPDAAAATNPLVTAYALTVSVLPMLLFGYLLVVQFPQVPWRDTELLPCYLFTAMLVLGELRPLLVARSDGDTDQVTVSTTFALALVLTGPLAYAMLVQGLAVAVSDTWSRRQPLRAAFNVGQYLLTLAAARSVFCLLTGTPFLAPTTQLTSEDIIPALLAGIAFFAVNNGTVAVAVALDQGRSALAVLAGDLRVQGLTSSILIGLAPVAAVLADHWLVLLPLIALPLVGVQRSAWIAAQRQHEALHDSLTGLPNRKLFRLRADRLLAGVRGDNALVGVMLLDLDHFKDVNDTLGHHVGDGLLREVAVRITDALPPGVTVARLGGDEFVVLIGPVAEADAVTRLAHKISARLSEPIVAEGVRLGVQASIGIALNTDHRASTDTMLQRADVALYLAKDNRGDVQVYRPEIDQNTLVRLNLLADLYTAAQNEEFELAFQPQIDTATGEVVALEALSRWHHPVHGVIEPDVFIPLAENSGAIRQMSQSAIEGALRTLHRLRGDGHHLAMAVNLSARVLSDLQVPAWVQRMLLETSVPSSLLTIEVTESTLIADPRRALRVLQELREMGVRLAIDDFGTGYSSLSYLQRLRPDDLKVDKSFVTDMLTDENDAVIVRSVIELAHGLGLTVVAEGVEDGATLALLAALHCDRAQGFHVARPMPERELTAWLNARRALGAQAAPDPQPAAGARP
ncbi:MAG TPA: EAL domain-containing protein [Kineosporiaceae bacterium]|nr:EAL domain-containing protein [Kineosporiaceae bacterium]